MAAGLKIPTKFTANDGFSPVIKRMIRSVKKWSDKSMSHIRRFDQKMTGVFKKMGRFAQLGLGVGIGIISQNALATIATYEQATADLSAVMNTTSQNQRTLAIDAERLGSITAKSATEVVGLQEAFARLGFETPQIVNMTEATISGSIAMNAELSDTAELVGAMVKTFDNFSSIDTPDIIDKMTLSTQKSALNFEKLQTALPIVAGAANAAGVGIEPLLALLGKLSDAGIDASSSSNSLKRIFIESKKAGLDYGGILKKISKESDTLTASVDKFGVRAAVSSSILAKKLAETATLTNQLSDATIFQGAASKAAEKRLDTFTGSVTLLKSAYEGLLLRTNESSGALRIFRSLIDFTTNNIGAIATVLATVIGLFVTMKAVVLAATIANTAYSIGIGIIGALSGTASIAIGANSIALGTYQIVTWIATAATTAFSIAINSAIWPITLVILAIVAIIAIIKNWKTITTWFWRYWGDFTTFISDAWTDVVKWFEDFSFADFFMDIGKSILKFMLSPLEAVLKLIRMIPGKEMKIVTSGLDFIDDIKASIDGTATERNTYGVLSSPEVAASKATTESIQNGAVQLNINDKGNNVESVESTGEMSIPINLTQTQGAF